MKLSTSFVLAPLVALLLLGSCGKKTVEPAANTSSFAVELEPLVGSSNLQLNTQTYTKADGQAFTVSKFKLLLSNLTLTRADGSSYVVPDSYYLLDAANPKQLLIDQVPVGDYTGLSFVVGVDAAHNNGTFVSGDLNHSNDLYWEWSNEYVFLKMAGTSPQAGGGSGRALTFDIGGADAVRTVRLPFGSSVLPVKDGHVPGIHVGVNLLGLFESATPAKNVNFVTTYSVESGNPWAAIIADNYAARMFTIEHIHPN